MKSGKIERFEDLIGWQKAREMTRDAYQVTKQGRFARDFGLANQMQRACVSVMSNIAEGFERWGSKEFEHFLSMAKASCAEVRSQLYVAFDCGYLNEDTWAQLYAQAEEVGRIVGGLRKSAERQTTERQRQMKK